MDASAPARQSGETAVPGVTAVALLSRVRMIGWCVVAGFGLIEAAYSRHTMQADGISYLDMGDAILRGDWTMAANAYWSPLYPFLEGLVLKVLHPSAPWEFTVVHCVNFLIYLLAFGCFEYLLRAAVAIPPLPSTDSASTSLPRWAIFALGYTIFLWSSLSLITMERVTPDMLMAGFVYLAVGLLLRIWQQPAMLWRFFLMGGVLGLGYLAKAPLFALSLVFFVFLWILAGNWRRAVPGVLAATLTFAVVAAPFAGLISRAKGRFTFGDTGKINYVFLVDGAGPGWYFQNLGTAGGHYKHPVRRIFDAPPIYEFATPIKGTIPVWYDPSYWADGAAPRVHPRQELALILHYVGFYLELIFTSQSPLLVGLLVLCFLGGRKPFLHQLAAFWPVWLMGLAGLGMYSLIYVELRYVAVFFTLLWVGLFAGLVVPPGRDSLRVVSLLTLAVVITMAAPLALSAGEHLVHVVYSFAPEPDNQWQVAEDLRRLGVSPGDKIGRIGGRHGTGWARLLRVIVVAEVPRSSARDYWYATPEQQARVIETFRHLGVTAIVAEQIPPLEVFTPAPGWVKLGDGTFYAWKMPPGQE